MKTAIFASAWLTGIYLLAMASMPATAQHAHELSPYAHSRGTEVASLTDEEVSELRHGEGMGLARAAELNHFPGPKHLLELAPELGLSNDQVSRIRAIHDRMKSRAIAKGEDIIMAESHLAELFASGKPSIQEMTRVTGHLGTMRGQLQAIHLLAHIESAKELSHVQIRKYDRLRGYLN
ncbi:MAG: hypothetical protein F4Z15_09145 [Gammaproteobacteria bacterium]|nr:hypothetical protein [Gammaproteobacteria bacterium]MYD76637.1 hypothetical protein [Gammaproteobacteria bacterium]MYJ52643.1 hypothetical protein [Gammaproteobacteria bacterium]